MQEIDCLYAISPIDGRYREITQNISEYFSEYAYIKNRVIIEIDWLKFFIKNILKDNINIEQLENIILEFDIEEAKRIKEIEEITKHDVKAIEYYLREKMKTINLKELIPYIHIGCTSEDINNLAYGRMINGFLKNIFKIKVEELINIIKNWSKQTANIPMLAHTHGQKATPTTIGKELANFVYRYENIYNTHIKNIKLKGKFSGAVGNFNAINVAYPEIDWIKISKEFVESEELEFNLFSTQIETHDTICMLFSFIKLLNNITMDFNSDMWMYISMNYFKQKAVKQEVGSSVMPHKVNPIFHENSMANIRVANSLFDSLINNLQISRMQRDLSDSSMLRNIGVAMAHTIISIEQTKKAISRMEVNDVVLKNELEDSPEVLTEAIQTILRKNKIDNAYELLKDFSRNKKITLREIQEFVQNLEINEEDKQQLLSLSPEKYIGLAEKLVNEYI